MDRAEKALELRKKGYNCAQSVVCAFADVAGVDEQVLFRIAEGFGSGMGGQQHVCGAVAGAVMVNGLLNSSGRPGNVDSLIKTLGVSRQLTEGFCVQNGTAICKELKGTETGKMIRSCPDCVMDAARLAEAILLENADAAFQN